MLDESSGYDKKETMLLCTDNADRRGNLTAVSRGEEQLKAFTFDAANRMRSAYEIKDGTGKRAEYTYNAFGNRIGQDIYGSEADNGIPEAAGQKLEKIY